jgi:hypothetical protein
MALGPIEILMVAFPGNQFSGDILPELERLIDADTISIVDGLLVIKDSNGEVAFRELSEDSSAAILVFEHTWAKPLRDAIVDSGGVLAANFRVPGLVVDELLNELESID